MIDFILNITQHLQTLTIEYGIWIYAILFLIVFCETGLVITPFLPGDSMLFAAGSIAAIGGINAHILAIILVIAAILGDTVNFFIGKYIGDQLFINPDSKIFRRSYLEHTEKFYQIHGGKTVILARFIPIIRTFAPFVAGMGHMNYPRFLQFNVIGGIVWVVLFVYLGYFFGQTSFVKQNLSLILIAIIVLSIMPTMIAGLQQYISKRNKQRD